MGPYQQSLILFVVLLGYCCAGLGNGSTSVGHEQWSTGHPTKEPEQADILTEVGHINNSIDFNKTALKIHDRLVQDDERSEAVNVTIIELNITSDVVKIQLKAMQSSKTIFKNRTLSGGVSVSSFDANTKLQNNSHLIHSDVIMLEKQNSSMNITAIQKKLEADSFAPGDFSQEILNATKFNVVKIQNVTKIKEKQEILHTLNTNENQKTLNTTTIGTLKYQKTSIEDIQPTLKTTNVEENRETVNATKTSTPPLSVFGNETEYLSTNKDKTDVIKYLNVTINRNKNSNESILLNATTASFQTNLTTEDTKSARKNVIREWSADTVPLPRHHDVGRYSLIYDIF